MARYRTSVRSPWHPADAYDVMKDLSRFDEWDPGITAAVLVSGEAGAVGSTYDLTVKGIGGGTVMRYEIVDAVPGTSVEARSQTSTLESVDVITVVPDGDSGCIVTYDADLRLRGPLRVVDPLLALLFRRIGDRAAAGLRRRLDGVAA
jgi:hypothetical protein